MISNALEGAPLPVYGDGLQIRDWLYVDDHCRGIHAVLQRGREGEVYNIGGNCALPNREVITRVLQIVGAPETLMQTVADRPGHDRRYALASEKLARETGFVPQMSFELGLPRDGAVVSRPRGLDRTRSIGGIPRLLPPELRLARFVLGLQR